MAQFDSLCAFMRHCSSLSPSHIVLGNEAADLDSVASSIALSFATHTSSTPVIPVVSIPQQQLHLRPDVVYALALVGLQHSDLVFIDSVSNPLHNCKKVTLVDHNQLSPEQTHLADRVTALIDHHHDSLQFPHAHPRLIETVGSCCTLVAEHIFMSSSKCPPDLAILLLCAILLDTGNLSATSGKTTPKDVTIATKLRHISGWDEDKCDHVYDMLKEKRRDVSLFSVPQLLRKDLKTYVCGGHKVAIASIGTSPQELVRKAKEKDGVGLNVCVEKFASEIQVDCLMLLCRFKDDRRMDERFLGIMKGKLGDQVWEKGVPEMEMEKSDVQGGLWWFRFQDYRVSRKIVAPAVLTALEDIVKHSLS